MKYIFGAIFALALYAGIIYAANNVSAASAPQCPVSFPDVTTYGANYNGVHIPSVSP